jgi:UDP-N-acetylmuramyl pentapeptide phosphotransferase/UDP-N-acetylglucosamine-1-phosphate transferase
MNIIFFCVTLLFSLIINYIAKKKNILLNLTGSAHQKFVSSDSVPLSGGLTLILNSYYYLNSPNQILTFFIICIFCLGFLSDINLLNSPKLRFILQIIIIFCIVHYSSIIVSETRIIFLDYFLENSLFQIFFTIFCILIVINGFNFIDGVNTAVLGYCLIISIIFYYLDLKGEEVSQLIDLYRFLPILIALFILNFFNKLYLGDSGSYLLGLLFSLFLINTYQVNSSISPLFIVCVLWYPAFENLFSIIRKIKFSKSPINPDTNHLHQLIFYNLKKNSIITNQYLNTSSGIIINFYNLLSILLATQYFDNSQVQMVMITFNIILYTFVYMKLISKKN